MKQLILASVLALTAMTSTATVLNFDNAGAAQNGYVQLGTYQGFVFQSNILAIDTVNSYWNYGAVSGDFTMLNNNYSAIVVRAANAADFTFSGLWAKTWGNNATRGGTIYGYNNGALVASSAVNVTPNFAYMSGFAPIIDELRIDLGEFFLVDNLALNEQRVPEPASLALLGVGLAGIAAARRRKKADA